MIDLRSRNIYYAWAFLAILILFSIYFLGERAPKSLPIPLVIKTNSSLEKTEPIKSSVVSTGASPIVTSTVSELTQNTETEIPKRIDISFWWLLKWLPFTMDGWCQKECDEMDSDIGSIYNWDDQKPNDYEKWLIHDAVIYITCWSLSSKPCSNSDKIFDGKPIIWYSGSIYVRARQKEYG